MWRRLSVARTERKNASRVRARSLVARQTTTPCSRVMLDAAQFSDAHARRRLTSASLSQGSAAWNAFDVSIRVFTMVGLARLRA